MGAVKTSEMAGKIIRRVREDQGISRAELAKRAGIGPRTLYALETGGSENFGLGNYLKLLHELKLTMSVDADGEAMLQQPDKQNEAGKLLESIHWNDLASIWKLDGERGNE